jgi:lysozyme family protein
MIFRTALEKTLQYEGDYSNHPADHGGETYRGIARNYHKYWSGWKIVDAAKDKDDFLLILKNNYKLQLLVEDFYFENYWQTKRLDLEKLSVKFPTTAVELFDIAVNMGVKQSAKFLQHALNLLNRNQKNYKNITVDGYIGPATEDILYSSVKEETDYLIKLIILLRAKRYIEIIENNESQEIFIRGWMNRIKM